jgi:hypothetical protein
MFLLFGFLPHSLFFVFFPKCWSGGVGIVGGTMVPGCSRYHAQESYVVLTPCFLLSSSSVLFFLLLALQFLARSFPSRLQHLLPCLQGFLAEYDSYRIITNCLAWFFLFSRNNAMTWGFIFLIWQTLWLFQGDIVDPFLKICIDLLGFDELPTHWCYKLDFSSNVVLPLCLLEVKKQNKKSSPLHGRI